jgi:hypothetical protein
MTADGSPTAELYTSGVIVDKKEIYEKAEKVIQQAFEMGKESVKAVSQKAGEAAHATKLLIQKASLEHQIQKRLAEMGMIVYQQAQTKSGLELNKELQRLVDETRSLDAELSKVETSLEAKSGNK